MPSEKALYLLTFFRVRKSTVLGAVLTQSVRTLLELPSEIEKAASQRCGAEFVSEVSETSASYPIISNPNVIRSMSDKEMAIII